MMTGAPGRAQGASSLRLEWAPQSGGVTSGARSPPLKRTLSSSKGSWGFSAKVVVSCPVGDRLDLAGELDLQAALGAAGDDVDRQ